MNKKLSLGIIVLLGMSLACQTLLPDNAPPAIEPLPPAEQPVEPDVVEQPVEEPTEEVISSDDIALDVWLSGERDYRVTVHEQGCGLSLSTEYQSRVFTFYGDKLDLYNPASDNTSTYEKQAEGVYLRNNSADKPIVVRLSYEGFVLEVHEGDDPLNEEPCGYFVFQLVDSLPDGQPLPAAGGGGDVSFEEFYSGEHNFTIVVEEQGCPLSLTGDEYQSRIFRFYDDKMDLTNPGSDNTSTYEKQEEGVYLRYNSADKAIMIRFSYEGYVLEIHNEGADPLVDLPCGYFIFSLDK